MGSIISVSMMLITPDIGSQSFGIRRVLRITLARAFEYIWMDANYSIRPVYRLLWFHCPKLAQMKTLALSKKIPGIFWAGFLLLDASVASWAADTQETAGGWRKYEANPVLGGSLGNCFDVALLRE